MVGRERDPILPPSAETSPAAAQSPRELAARYGLTKSGARPCLIEYSVQLWRRRHFIIAFASAKNIAVHANARLGQLWHVLTPLLNAVIYYVVFGIFLRTSHGIHNFIAYLVVGIFVFHFTQGSVLDGARAISGNLRLIREIHFPRACLPIAFVVLRLQQMLVLLVVLLAVAVATGEPVTWRWLLLLPILVVQFLFNAGLSLGIARIGASATDINQLIPFTLRSWMYFSGVFWSIGSVSAQLGPWAGWVLEANPAAVFINLVRGALITVPDTPNEGNPVSMYFSPSSWLLAICWAVLVGAGGFIYFWKAEDRYGRG